METLQQLATYMIENDLKLATAESCTAGLVASEVASLEGSGSWLTAGFIVYQPETKMDFLDVDPETIKEFALTSEEVAREMAIGALRRGYGNVATANTGVAGPGPGEGNIAAGTVCIAWAFRPSSAGGDPKAGHAENHYGDDTLCVYTETCHFEGDRNAVRKAAAHYSLLHIPDYHQRYCNAQAISI